MKLLQYVGTFDLVILRDQLRAAVAAWRVDYGNGVIIEYFGMAYDETNSILTLMVPNDADEQMVQQVIDGHDPSAQLYLPLSWREILGARQALLNLPNWATWTPEEAEACVNADILSGMTKVEIEGWIETNVTNLDTAKTALKLVGGEIVDLRLICSKMAYSIMLLRNVAIRRRV